MEVIDHIIEIKETLGGIVNEVKGTREQVTIANGRTNKLETRVSTLESINTAKNGGLGVWKLLAGGSWVIVIIILTRFLAIKWK